MAEVPPSFRRWPCPRTYESNTYIYSLQYFEAPYSSVALIGSLINTIAFGMGPVSSLLVNKFGARPVCIVGGLLCIIGFSSSVLSPNIGTMIGLYGLVAGLGLGLMYVPTIISCNYYFDKKRALANGKRSYGPSCATIRSWYDDREPYPESCILFSFMIYV